jgi:hypothetical protein
MRFEEEKNKKPWRRKKKCLIGFNYLNKKLLLLCIFFNFNQQSYSEVEQRKMNKNFVEKTRGKN